jgi:hypothetical protein
VFCTLTILFQSFSVQVTAHLTSVQRRPNRDRCGVVAVTVRVFGSYVDFSGAQDPNDGSKIWMYRPAGVAP